MFSLNSPKGNIDMKKRFIQILISVIMLTFLNASALFHLNTVYSEQNRLFPEVFMLSDKNIVQDKESIIPGLKSQGPYNTCWAFSALGAIESNLLKKGLFMDFSEAYLSYVPYSGLESFPRMDVHTSYLNNGGSHYIASAVLSSGRGMTSEKEIGYVGSSDTIDLILAQNTKLSSDFIVKDIDYLYPFLSPNKSVDQNSLKSILYERKEPAVCYISADEDYINHKTCSINCSDSYHQIDDNYCHSVMIIGWDDNYSKTNFKENHMPKENGAWCAWSSSSYNENSEKGELLWISYEDNSLLDPVVYSSVEPNYYQNIYQYDTYGWTTSLNCSFLSDGNKNPKRLNPDEFNTGLMANLFKAKDYEYISSVGFYTISENTRYTVSIFTDIDIQDSSKGCTDPWNEDQFVDGGELPIMKAGEIALPGYHVVELDRRIPVDKGSYFSVVIEVSTDNSNYCFPVEARIEYTLEKAYDTTNKNLTNHNRLIGTNESFIYNFAKNEWVDLSGFFAQNKLYIESRFSNAEMSNCFMLPYPELAKKSDQADDPENGYKFHTLYGVIGNLCIKAFSESIPTGDIDLNDRVDIFDLLKIQKNILDPDFYSQPSGKQLFFDVSKDNVVSISDLTEMKKIILTNNYQSITSEYKKQKICSEHSDTSDDFINYPLLKTSDIKK